MKIIHPIIVWVTTAIFLVQGKEYIGRKEEIENREEKNICKRNGVFKYEYTNSTSTTTVLGCSCSDDFIKKVSKLNLTSETNVTIYQCWRRKPFCKEDEKCKRCSCSGDPYRPNQKCVKSDSGPYKCKIPDCKFEDICYAIVYEDYDEPLPEKVTYCKCKGICQEDNKYYFSEGMLLKGHICNTDPATWPNRMPYSE